MAISLTQTTLSGAVSISAGVIPVASATGISAPTNNVAQNLYIIDPGSVRGELVSVTGVNGTQISVSRLSLWRSAHAAGAAVVIGVADPSIGQSFQEYDPVGAVASIAVTPWINAVNGNQWLLGTDGVWVPGWNNTSAPIGVSATVASAAGVVTPSGRLFHVTGTAAITGWTLPVGFTGGSFTVIPDGAFTWTTATNIALAGTAVVNRELTFTWDAVAAKWNPSYV